MFWTALWATLLANAITVLVIYCAVAYQRGQPLLLSGARFIGGVTALGWRVVQFYIALIFLGAVAFAVKLLLYGG